MSTGPCVAVDGVSRWSGLDPALMTLGGALHTCVS